MDYPKNLLNDLNIEVENLPEDFYPTLHYILQASTDKRASRIFLMRYRDGKTFEDIGSEFEISRQRANVIVQDVLQTLSSQENRDMLTYGMKGYMEYALQNRINSRGSLLESNERDTLVKNAYERGYENGKRDALTGREDNKADLASVRKIRVASLPFSVRSSNCFMKNDIFTLGDIIDRGDTLKDMTSFGKVSFKEVVNTLLKYDVDVKSIFPRTLMEFEIELP